MSETRLVFTNDFAAGPRVEDTIAFATIRPGTGIALGEHLRRVIGTLVMPRAPGGGVGGAGEDAR